MKKRLICLILIALLVAMMLPVTAFSGDSVHYFVSVDGNDMDNDGTVNRPLKTIDEAVKRISEVGKGEITLLSDITLYTSQIIDSDIEITIDLNGHDISMTSTAINVSIFKIKDRGMLTIDNYNSSTIAVIKSGSKSVRGVFVDEGGIFNLNNGTISLDASENDYAGVGVYVSKFGTFNMKGGLINGCTSTTNGAGVYVDEDGTFNMDNGTINSCSIVNPSDDSYGNGGGVYINSDGTFNMLGGTIMDNSSPAYGAGVYVAPSATFNLTDGKITQNSSCFHSVANFGTFSMKGGEIIGNNSSINPANSFGVYSDSNATITLGKNSKIIDNANNNNLKLAKGAKINIATGSDAPNGMLIGLNMAEPGVFTTKPAPNLKDCFIAQNGDGYIITYNTDNTLLMTKKKKISIADMENGTVTASKETALIGDTVKLNVAPDNGYELDTISGNDGEKPIQLTEISSGVYSFTMPDKAVTINATFKKSANIPQIPIKATNSNPQGNDPATPLFFSSQSEINNFELVRIDKKFLVKKNYTVTSGSTVITLLPEFLKTLTPGLHNIEIVSKDGIASADFIMLSAKDIPNENITPATGDFNYSIVWVTILIIGVGIVSGLTVFRGKK